MKELAAWINMADPFGLRLIHAAGGHGKTRLANHFAAICAQQGWAVWRVIHDASEQLGTLVGRLPLPESGKVLAVVDYADRWSTSHLLALIGHLRKLSSHAPVMVRVLLLARSASFWWPAMVGRLDSDYALDAAALSLPPLGSQVDPATMFAVARDPFADYLEAPEAKTIVAPAFVADESHVLAVHMAALAAVDACCREAKAPSSQHAVSAYLLRREHAHWSALHERSGRTTTNAATMRRATYLATLIGGVSRPETHVALQRSDLASSPEAANQIIDDHQSCYPPTTRMSAMEPLLPDRLGEDLIGLSTPSNSVLQTDSNWLFDDWTLTAPTNLLSHDTPDQAPPWTAHAVTVLIEAAHRWPHIAEQVLIPLLNQRPHLAVTAGGATLIRLIEIPNVDPDLLLLIEPLLPRNRHVDLDVAAAVLTARIKEHWLPQTENRAVHAGLHSIYAWRLRNSGRFNEAIPPATESMNIYRELAGTDPDAHLGDLAMSLTNFGLILAEANRRVEALAPTEEAVRIYRQLCGADPASYLQHLASGLHNLGMFLSIGEFPEQAIAHTEEAVAIRQRLAETEPGTYLSDLARSLCNLCAEQSMLNRHDDALSSAKQAIKIYRRLSETNPAIHLPDLARTSYNLGIILAELDRRDQAISALQDAVAIYRNLGDSNPRLYLADLALSLRMLSENLLPANRVGEAASAVEEAVAVYANLVDEDAPLYLPKLAGSLHSLGGILVRLGRDDAPARVKEAIDIYRELSDLNPTLYVPALATSLWAYAFACSSVERNLASALGAISEAISVFEALAVRLPQQFVPSLMGSYFTFSYVLDGLGQTDDANEIRLWLQAQAVEDDIDPLAHSGE
ncbi:tetratricopeptide repeat protein [Jidongwangia harbinensis]|uniref:tetratricopeptide repeat protein n=1 Tax=Jidongwangia harbinensis TaxID=2878561 RepID=UPI001CD93188|nr:tetratricopeptide repeat protein [Jidongwangia harbinensis]MCA2219486.1 tetratricopeptide repeat protein [Jidongwangia harbinensis]